MARAKYEQKESCEAAILRMVLNSYIKINCKETEMELKDYVTVRTIGNSNGIIKHMTQEVTYGKNF